MESQLTPVLIFTRFICADTTPEFPPIVGIVVSGPSVPVVASQFLQMLKPLHLPPAFAGKNGRQSFVNIHPNGTIGSRNIPPCQSTLLAARFPDKADTSEVLGLCVTVHSTL